MLQCDKIFEEVAVVAIGILMTAAQPTYLDIVGFLEQEYQVKLYRSVVDLSSSFQDEVCDLFIVLLSDNVIHELEGVAYIKRHNPAVNIVVLSQSEESREFDLAYQFGAQCFSYTNLLSHSNLTTIVQQFSHIAQKQIYLAPNLIYLRSELKVIDNLVGESYRLTAQEDQLISLLAHERYGYITNQSICETIWKDYPKRCNVRNLISRIKKKIPALKNVIRSQFGIGYTLRPIHKKEVYEQ
jgi:DNA-binding response OmpR family regulator